MKKFLTGFWLVMITALAGKLAPAQTADTAPADLVQIVEHEMQKRGIKTANLIWAMARPDSTASAEWALYTRAADERYSDFTGVSHLRLGGGWYAVISKADRRVVQLIGQR